MEKTVPVIIRSSKDALRKIAYLENNTEKYYSIVFLPEEDNVSIIAVSCQIGCCEGCLFCATGDQPFVRNLTSEEIVHQIRTSVSVLRDMLTGQGEQYLHILFEGMGEISYNTDQCFQAFDMVYPELCDSFSGITIRISSVGTKVFCQKYREYFEQRKDTYKNVTFEVKLSLHSPYDSERQYLMPCSGGKYRISEILDAYGQLASILGTKLICNYVLFSYPDGRNNYSVQHASELGRLMNKDTMSLMLGKYSETGKGFVSPGNKEYIVFYYILKYLWGIETSVQTLLGQDIHAACGMLSYQEQADGSSCPCSGENPAE